MNILIVGLGSIGLKHLRVLQLILPDSKVFALRSSKTSGSNPGVIDIHDYNEIKSLNIDFSIISNPTSEHKNTISRLMEFGFPLFIEKPLSSSIDIADIVDRISKTGMITYVACNLRFLDCIRFVKETMLNKGKKLNEVNVYCGSFLPDWRPHIDFKKTYSASEELGGGVHRDLIHELDYLYWIFGGPNKITRFFKSQSSLQIPSTDYANYILEYDGFCASIILNYYRRDPKRTLELVFDNETWFVDLLKNEIISNGKSIYTSDQRIPDTYVLQMRYFIDCLFGNILPFNTITDAFNVLKICLGDDSER